MMTTKTPGNIVSCRVLRLMAVVLALAVSSWAAYPQLLNYQGVLQDGSGKPLAGPVSLEITLYDAPTGGTVVYQELHTDVALTNGIFQIPIGGGTPSGSNLSYGDFLAGTVYVEVSVDGGAPLTPRQQLVSVPYAFQADFAQYASSAGDASTLQNLAPASFQRQITSECAAGSSIRAVDPSGGVTCEPDTDTHLTETEVDAAVSNNGYAFTGHGHAAGDITSGVLADARFNAYSNLTAYGRLDNTDFSDLLTRSQLDSRYTLVGHGHAASDITSGYLSDDRFDAYSNLAAYGHLGNQYTTDLLMRVQLDDRYVQQASQAHYAISALTLVSPDLVRHVGSGEAYPHNGLAQVWATAPVHLPDLAVVSQLSCTLMDKVTDGHVEVNLVRQFGTSETVMAFVKTVDAETSAFSQTLTNTSIVSGTIGNDTAAYYLMVYFYRASAVGSSDLSLNQCRIDYANTPIYN